MGGPTRPEQPGARLWWLAAGALAVVLVAGLRGPLARTTIVAPLALFWLVTIGAGVCYFGALWAVIAGWRDNLAEIAIVGGALAVQSQLALVHGLTAPGVWYGTTTVVTTSAFIALPVALIVAAPALIRHDRAAEWVGRWWRWWVPAWLVAATGLDAIMLGYPNALPAPRTGQPVPVMVGVASLVVAVVLSRRHLGLYQVGGRRASLVTSVALVSLGLSGLVWLGDRSFSLGWWFAHLLDIGGVTAGAVALAAGFRSERPVAEILAPVTTRDPLVALDLGLSPTIHRFVAALQHKDAITRDHVVRVAELAVRAGEQHGLRGSRLRHLGLGALLHDIGKLDVPEAILTKPGRLSDEEMVCMQEHTVIGERMLIGEPELRAAAVFVRSHHERFDGRGYPDGLAGDEIPFEVAVISAADAFDAMAHTRHYRQGMGAERAAAILDENAGAQWHPRAVELVLAAAQGGAGTGAYLVHAGTHHSSTELACGCIDALPQSAQAELLDAH